MKLTPKVAKLNLKIQINEIIPSKKGYNQDLFWTNVMTAANLF